jgi:hypothetical protein
MSLFAPPMTPTTSDDPRRTGAWPNTVLRRRGRTTGAPEHVAPHSLHAVLRGREVYETRIGRHALEPGRYLVLNAGQEVRTEISREERVDSISVMFEHAFAQEVLASLVTPIDRLLDDPDGRGPAGVVFFERTYPVDPALARWLRRDEDRAVARVREPIRRFAEKHGVPQLYHETITRFWVAELAAAMPAIAEESDFATLAAQRPDLLDKDLVRRRYRPETLASERAKAAWVEPDA